MSHEAATKYVDPASVANSNHPNAPTLTGAVTVAFSALQPARMTEIEIVELRGHGDRTLHSWPASEVIVTSPTRRRAPS